MKSAGTSFFGALLVIITLSFTQSESTSTHSISKDYRLYAASWLGLSAESRACYRQGYRMAEMALQKINAQKSKSGKPKAIITDLDETVLDNSAWAFKVILEEKDYPFEWENWEKEGKAPAFPGAVEFFQMAAKEKTEVFYVSNRLQKNISSTVENLKKLGLPFADEKHILLKTTESNKVARRAAIGKYYEIVLLLGDNLADFDGVWEEAKETDRTLQVTNHDADWGTRFIVFPNPVYGGWKDAIFDYKRNLSTQHLDSVWEARLRAYNKEIGY